MLSTLPCCLLFQTVQTIPYYELFYAVDSVILFTSQLSLLLNAVPYYPLLYCLHLHMYFPLATYCPLIYPLHSSILYSPPFCPLLHTTPFSFFPRLHALYAFIRSTLLFYTVHTLLYSVHSSIPFTFTYTLKCALLRTVHSSDRLLALSTPPYCPATFYSSYRSTPSHRALFRTVSTTNYSFWLQ
jgi:hypothetical protein